MYTAQSLGNTKEEVFIVLVSILFSKKNIDKVSVSLRDPFYRDEQCIGFINNGFDTLFTVLYNVKKMKHDEVMMRLVR